MEGTHAVFALQVTMRQAPEFVIDQGHQVVHRLGIAFLPLLQQLRDFALGLCDHKGSAIPLLGYGLGTTTLRFKFYKTYV